MVDSGIIQPTNSTCEKKVINVAGQLTFVLQILKMYYAFHMLTLLQS